ncbi:MAG: type II toxin-antitoxin system PemK/MazF family toxin [Firmicutes bacterium]|nr:type II toxin-antitoxin system PemK/MazF family toxin [Bacillota bacterium]NSW93055.1 type II toxin-antitoxin system PemK/MazF family toxin [Bacillota bacterium]
MVINQYTIYWTDLDPTKGSEMKKVRPCVVISPNEMNHNIDIVIIAPLTSTSKNYPFRVKTKLDGRTGWIVLDQIRAIDKSRLIKEAGQLEAEDIISVKAVIKEMLVD